MSNIIVSPSILSADFANLERDIKKVEQAGADWIHVDVMDGHFVPNITIGIPVVKSLRKVTALPLDVHLMISEPMKYVEDFANAGADIITIHYEPIVKGVFARSVIEHVVKQNIEKIKSLGVKVGLSIKPKTSANVVLPYLNDLDMLLVMTVEPGFGGQKFMDDCSKKIEVIRRNAPENLIIQVDGGINAQSAKICKDYGANCLVAGNYIYKSDDVKKAIESLK